MVKKLMLIIIVLLIIGLTSFSIYYMNENLEKKPTNNTNKNQKPVLEDKDKEDEDEFIDNNPIVLGLYKYYGKAKNRELIQEYVAPWEYHKDISSFEVFYTNDLEINNKWLPTTFDEYKNNYEDIDNYRIGYIIEFSTINENIKKTILTPKDTEDFFKYLEVYLYDDYHRQNGVWYSHTTENEFKEETLLTSIKLTAGTNIAEINSDIKVFVFTYDNDDFDQNNNYRGKSIYNIVVKRS